MSARDTIPSPSSVEGARGVRLRIASHPAGPARDAYESVMCSRKGIPLRACPWWVLLALGFALGSMFGLVCGAGAAGGHVSVVARTP